MNGVANPGETDEALLDRLRSVLEQADPVPEHVLEGSRALFGLRRLDEELAELVRDSAEERAGCSPSAARATSG